jgi:hypothetical protein
MLKVAFFQGEDESGPRVVPLFGPADRLFEKTAAPTLLPEVAAYIASLRPRPDAQYVLVNAMGASEWWGSNINGDAFPEASLIHTPDDWTGNPLIDKIRARDWPYGYPTFYFAYPYAHHRNKDSTRAFGEVELAAWHPRMKRVELVVRVDEEKCQKFGGVGVWDKLKAGQHPDVSMGCKVPYDTCSICLDWDTYRRAQGMFSPGRDKSPGDAVLRYHKELQRRNGKGIRGVSITRADYCEHAKKSMNRILPDGRKVFVYNDYPKFFDISFVFIGADKTAKVMMKIAGEGSRGFWHIGSSAELAEKLGYADGDDILLPELAPEGTVQLKTASSPEAALKFAFLGKQAKNKDAEIIKDVVPSQFAGKAVPVLTSSEADLPRDVLDALGSSPLEHALSTPSGLGMVLRPREFQRIILIQMGHRPLADRLESEGTVFPKSEDRLDVPMGPSFFSPLLAHLLAPLMASRSALGPAIEKRVLVASTGPKEKQGSYPSLSSGLLRKIGAAYNSYRDGVMELVAHTQDLVASMTTASSEHLHKFASAPVDEIFTPLSVSYLKQAFWDEVQEEKTADVERGLPSRNTQALSKKTAGGH